MTRFGRCETCGLSSCRNPFHHWGTQTSLNPKPKKRLMDLKKFYAEISKVQAQTPEDWYRCSVCSSVIHHSCLPSHQESCWNRSFYDENCVSRFDKMSNLNGLDSSDEVLTVEESLGKLTKACEGCTGDEACCAIVGLKQAGWDVQINPAIAYGDRKGYQITILEPKKGIT